jgi:adenylate cyclase
VSFGIKLTGDERRPPGRPQWRHRPASSSGEKNQVGLRVHTRPQTVALESVQTSGTAFVQDSRGGLAMPSRCAAAARSQAISSKNDITPSDQEVRASLETLLNSKAFNASSRNRRFLAYVVDETLANRGDRIKAYSIAITAFDRADDFDPITDPIVRIEAARLRRSLEHYYLTAGQHDRIRIDIPKGAYVATFGYREVAHAPTSQPAGAAGETVESKKAEARPQLGPELPSATSRRRPGRTRLILPIAAVLAAVSLALYMAYDDVYEYRYAAAPDVGQSIRIDQIQVDPHNAGQFTLARGLTYELVSKLVSHNQFLVYAPDILATLPAHSLSTRPDYVLSGFAQSDGIIVRITVQLTDWRSGRVIWGSNFGVDMSGTEGFDFQVKASEKIVGAILRQVDPARMVEPERALQLAKATRTLQ